MKNLLCLDSCPSTQDLARDYLLSLEETLSEPFGLYTLNQTHGRGQYGNRWTSKAGQNLAYTLAFPWQDDTPPVMFNYYTALLVRAYLANLTGKELLVKWPNDLILNKKKVCGMLTETQKVRDKTVVLIGIGINGNQQNFQALPKASSLYLQTQRPVDLHALALGLHTQLCLGLGRLAPDTLEDYNAHLFRRDQVSVFVVKGKKLNGIIRLADAEGYLWIEHEHEGLTRYFHKEVELLY